MKKLSLTDLKVQSFVTSTEANDADTVKGGTGINTLQIVCIQTLICPIETIRRCPIVSLRCPTTTFPPGSLACNTGGTFQP